MKYARSGRSSIQRVYEAIEASSDLCLSSLRRFVDYGEKVLASYVPSIAPPASSRGDAPHDLREHMRFQLKMPGEFVEGSSSGRSLSSYRSVPFDGAPHDLQDRSVRIRPKKPEFVEGSSSGRGLASYRSTPFDGAPHGHHQERLTVLPKIPGEFIEGSSGGQSLSSESYQLTPNEVEWIFEFRARTSEDLEGSSSGQGLFSYLSTPFDD